MIQVAKIIGTGFITRGVQKVGVSRNLVIKNIYCFAEINIKYFSTSIGLLADKNSTSGFSSCSSVIEVYNPNKNSENNSNNKDNNSNNNSDNNSKINSNNKENNSVLPIQSENSNNNSFPYDIGNKINPDTLYLKDHDFRPGYTADSSRYENFARNTINIQEAIISSIDKEPSTIRGEFKEIRETLVNRNKELRDELRRRKDEGLIPDNENESRNSPSNNSGDSGLKRSDSPTIPVANEGNVAKGNAADTKTSSGIESAANKVDNDNDNDNNKGWLASIFKGKQAKKGSGDYQDSSDVTADTEPYDFIGGEDS